MATMDEAARYIDVDTSEFSELLDLGAIERKADGEYDLEKVLRSYLGYLRKVIAGHAKPTTRRFFET